MFSSGRITHIARHCYMKPLARLLSDVPPSTDLVITETLGPVRLIAINRPTKRNCVNTETAAALRQAFTEMENDSKINVAILYGKGGCFCAGYDLDELANQTDERILNADNFNKGPMGVTRTVSKKPVIAAIDGYAVAGGLELALWCDLRVMENSAIMGIFCRRFGVPLIDGGTVRLPALIGLSRSLDLILTGREVRSEEALNMGLVNRVCETGTSLGRAVMLAQEISKFPQKCMLADRQSTVNAAYSNNVQQLLDEELENGLKVIVEESIPGAKRFTEENIGRHGNFNIHNKPRKKTM